MPPTIASIIVYKEVDTANIPNEFDRTSILSTIFFLGANLVTPYYPLKKSIIIDREAIDYIYNDIDCIEDF